VPEEDAGLCQREYGLKESAGGFALWVQISKTLALTVSRLSDTSRVKCA
jgi:hypothetical protein